MRGSSQRHKRDTQFRLGLVRQVSIFARVSRHFDVKFGRMGEWKMIISYMCAIIGIIYGLMAIRYKVDSAYIISSIWLVGAIIIAVLKKG